MWRSRITPFILIALAAVSRDVAAVRRRRAEAWERRAAAEP
jgi:hypothetical protein